MSRNRAVIRLLEEDIAHLFALGPDEYVTGVMTEPAMDAISIRIEGPDLPEVAPGVYPPRIERPYSMVALRDKLALVWAERRPGGRLAGKPEQFADEIEALIKAAVFPHADV